MQNSDLQIRLKKNILQTLALVEERGYNHTFESLASSLIGGPVDKTELQKILHKMDNVVFDGVFVATKRNLCQKKCLKRKKTNSKLQPIYRKIAREFTDEFTRLCPWILCICFSGSIASQGLSREDDIDINIVVANGTKYTSWLIGIVLSLKYSWRYRKQFQVHWYNVITRVICISVIWEHRQVMPFQRQDAQLAYELYLNKDVIYNKKYYSKMLLKNKWLFSWFPQLKQIVSKKNFNIDKKNFLDKKKWLPRLFEQCNYYFVILLYFWIRAVIFWHKPLRDRMDHVNKVKYPYAMKDPIKIKK